MCKTYQKLPSDDWFDDIDFFERLWLLESWRLDEEEKHEFAKNYTIMAGYFTNPEMAREMVKAQNPDFVSSEEDVEKSLEMMKQDGSSKSKKRRRKIKTQV